MKKGFFLVITTVLLILGCDRDENNFNAFSKPELFTPALANITEETIQNSIPIAVNDFSSISDVSRGVTSISWVIDNGMSLLKAEFTPADSLNLDQFILSNARSSSKPEIFFLFQEAGLKEVRLRQTFNEEVSFLGQSAVQEGDHWIIETTFTYNVFDNLNPEAIIFNDDGTTELGRLLSHQNPDRNNSESFEIITIEAGSSLLFRDTTTIGNPDGRVWEFFGGSPEQSLDESSIVSFNRLGEYLVDITSTRDARGSTLSVASKTKTLPFKIKVIPSSQPFVAIDAKVVDDGGIIGAGSSLIEISVNGELADFDHAENSFLVHATNTGFDQNIPINAVQISSTDPTLIQVVLAEPVYNSDAITVSYDGVLPIASVDTRSLHSFTDLEVEPVEINVLQPASNPSFETSVNNDRNGNALGYNLFVGGGGNDLDNARNSDGSLQINRSTEQSSNGIASLKFDAEMPLVAGFLSYSNTIISNSNIPSGEYILSFDIYMEEGTSFNSIFSVIVGASPDHEIISLDSPITEEWFTVRRQFSTADPLSGNIILNFRNSDNIGIMGRQTFYLDHIRILVVENRP